MRDLIALLPAPVAPALMLGWFAFGGFAVATYWQTARSNPNWHRGFASNPRDRERSP